MIYIDASRYNNNKKRTGVENYSFFLINELAKKHPRNITLIAPKKVDLNVTQIAIPFPRLWTHLRLSWEILRNKKIDNLFVPSHVLPLIRPKKSTITIHDVAFKYSPKSYSLASRLYLNWATKFAVKRAKRIITPSQKTREDLIHYYHCTPQKISVIPLGFQAIKERASSKKNKEVLTKHGLRNKKYFIYVGRIEHKKNSDNLIKAFAQFSQKNPEIKLVMAGFPGHGGGDILKSIPIKLKNQIIQTGYVSDSEKWILMKNALCFIFPSRQEGFGIPLLEAMHANLPIIASNIPTSKEVAKDNALFFEVEDANQLAALMGKVAHTKDPKELNTEKHGETLKKYSWKNCGGEVWKVISRL